MIRIPDISEYVPPDNGSPCGTPPGFDYCDHVTPPVDLWTLTCLAKAAPVVGGAKVVVEVGSFAGLTAWAILREPSVTRLYCVDTWEGSGGDDRIEGVYARLGHDRVYYAFCSNLKIHLDRGALFPFNATSEMAATHAILPPLSMVFIDADHEAVAEDARLWLPRLAPGGILCGHDYGLFPSVTRDVEELAKTYKVRVRGLVWWLETPQGAEMTEEVTTTVGVDTPGPPPEAAPPAPPKVCDHDEVLAQVDVAPLMDSPGRRVADVTVRCGRCGVAFEWIGLPFGNDLNGATRATADGTVARIALHPKGEPVLPIRDAVARNFFIRPTGWKP